MTTKIMFNVPTIDQITFNLYCEDDFDNPPSVSIDNEDVVQGILDDYARGNEWAWCKVRVEAVWKNFTGNDHLGGCNYESEQDFKASGYYENMKECAYENLVQQFEELNESW